MSGAGFTPGPWAADEDDLSIMAEVGAHIASVTDVHQLPCIETEDEERVQAECLANAYLTAAGPCMFAALTEMVAAHPVCSHPIGPPGSPARRDQDRQRAAVIAAGAALARATGSAP